MSAATTAGRRLWQRGTAECVDVAVEKLQRLLYARERGMKREIEDTGVSLLGILFSFSGRMRRSRYLGWSIAAIAAFIITMLPILFLFRAIGTPGVAFYSALIQMLLIGAVPFLWILFCLGAKRCHDRDRSGWFLLVGIIPVIGWLWLLFELALRDGTPGRNGFGPSPKQVVTTPPGSVRP